MYMLHLRLTTRMVSGGVFLPHGNSIYSDIFKRVKTNPVHTPSQKNTKNSDAEQDINHQDQ